MPHLLLIFRLLDPDCWYKFTYWMANSADPDPLASVGFFRSQLIWIYSLQRQDISRFSRTRVNWILVQFRGYHLSCNMRKLPSDVCPAKTPSSCAFAQSDQTPRCSHVCILGYPIFSAVLGYLRCIQWSFWSDCKCVQADLNLRWAYMFKSTFSDVLAHLVFFFLFCHKIQVVDVRNLDKVV